MIIHSILAAGRGEICQITQHSLRENNVSSPRHKVTCEPCTCEATPGNTELSNRGIIDKDKHPVAEAQDFQKFACGIPITTVKHI
jgi:hypothetical protein